MRRDIICRTFPKSRRTPTAQGRVPRATGSRPEPDSPRQLQREDGPPCRTRRRQQARAVSIVHRQRARRYLLAARASRLPAARSQAAGASGLVPPSRRWQPAARSQVAGSRELPPPTRRADPPEHRCAGLPLHLCLELEGNVATGPAVADQKVAGSAVHPLDPVLLFHACKQRVSRRHRRCLGTNHSFASFGDLSRVVGVAAQLAPAGTVLTTAREAACRIARTVETGTTRPSTTVPAAA